MSSRLTMQNTCGYINVDGEELLGLLDERPLSQEEVIELLGEASDQRTETNRMTEILYIFRRSCRLYFLAGYAARGEVIEDVEMALVRFFMAYFPETKRSKLLAFPGIFLFLCGGVQIRMAA